MVGDSGSERRSRTDGADLIVSDPNSRVRGRRSSDGEPAAECDDGLLQLIDVPPHALREQKTLK